MSKTLPGTASPRHGGLDPSRRVKLLQGKENHAQIIQGKRIIGPGGNRARKTVRRFGQRPFVFKHDAEIIEGLMIVRINSS
jgi:hypothetical protein